jgi:plastocyanin
MTKLATLIAALAIAAIGLAACGGDDDETTTAAETTTTEEAPGGGAGGGGTISFEADPNGALAYTETEVSGPAGNDTIEFVNDSSTPHDVTIVDSADTEVARTEVITGDTTSVNATLEAGSYTFYCSVDGHREAGMEGTLTVE